ncbi:MAG: thiamine phosphate synthase [Bacteroidia bacterium]
MSNIEQGISNNEINNQSENFGVQHSMFNIRYSALKLVVISPESTVENETEMVNALFKEGLAYFHLRKPGFTAKEQEQYLSEIEPRYLKNITLHQHHSITLNNQISRLHFKEHERESMDISKKKAGMLFSSSIHDTENLFSWGDSEGQSSLWDYVFLGPVYSSISKPGYRNQALENIVLEKRDGTPKIIAIGGIDSSNAENVLKRGFDGIAVLGAIWNATNPPVGTLSTFKTLQAICN